MHRPALARVYRPRKFSEIVGQDHVSATLRTAVERGIHRALAKIAGIVDPAVGRRIDLENIR